MGIHRMRLDGSEPQTLTDVECDNYVIDEAGEWIYYSNEGDGSAMYRMRTDGTEIKKLNNDYSSRMQIVGEWIYYLKGRDGYPKIYRIPLNGITGVGDK
jgi:Tol biopolymer transport system component